MNPDSIIEWINAENVEVESEAASNEEKDDGKLMRFDGVANAHWWDVLVVAGEERFFVTKGHLAQHSSVFAEMFLAAGTKKKAFVVEDLDPLAFQIFLEIINGEPGLNDDNVEEVLKIAKKYSAPTAMKVCEQYLIRDSKLHIMKKLSIAVEYDLDDLKDVARTRNQSSFQLGIDDIEAERRKESLCAKLEEASRLYHHSCEQLKKQMALDAALKNEEKRRIAGESGTCDRCGNVYGNEDPWKNGQGNGVGHGNQWGFGNGYQSRNETDNANSFQFGNIPANRVSPVYFIRYEDVFQGGNTPGNRTGSLHQNRYQNGNQWRQKNGNANGNGYQWGNGNSNGHGYQRRHPNGSQMGNANVFQFGNGNSNVNPNTNPYQWGFGSANGAQNPFQFGQANSQN